MECVGTSGGRLRETDDVEAGLDDDDDGGDDDVVKISVVLREAPTNLRDNLLVNSQHFESNYKKLRAIIQAYLSSNKSWHANDLRNDTKESDPMEV